MVGPQLPGQDGLPPSLFRTEARTVQVQPQACPHLSWSTMLTELRAARLRGASASERLMMLDRWRRERCENCTITCLYPMPELPSALREQYEWRPR
ncbi:MAG TPA: hypothetical protein PKE44_03625 [Plasticicumulans sp.]|uniref:hypothetical protein n=2 Tax=Plasticicumulans sp. TaxID=2307179 RepID=UPI002CB965AE|nr:hypothetical protein [Plasticicumulans sp.]HMV39238.1 hypothetical protein [Plasticicumulans sp.]HMW28642.1 hypothetical protein [Plasticicumulans sp.]HMW41342.1 hypothetical protein [Plasticicumulans sp.]HND99132.1 hypothetical protein [Plasticicumulans sp.]HNF66538.1 hypothetical protein [Plasticicumulans sp.]